MCVSFSLYSQNRQTVIKIKVNYLDNNWNFINHLTTKQLKLFCHNLDLESETECNYIYLSEHNIINWEWIYINESFGGTIIRLDVDMHSKQNFVDFESPLSLSQLVVWHYICVEWLLICSLSLSLSMIGLKSNFKSFCYNIFGLKLCLTKIYHLNWLRCVIRKPWN